MVHIRPKAEQSRAPFCFLDCGRGPELESQQGQILFLLLGWRTKWKPYCLLPHIAINNYENKCTCSCDPNIGHSDHIKFPEKDVSTKGPTLKKLGTH